MKDLLNNRWVIIVLCGFAVLMLIRSVTSSLGGAEQYTNDIAEYDWLDDTSGGEKAAINKDLQLLAVDTKALYWGDEPKRDPFSDETRFTSGDINAIRNQAIAKMGDINNTALQLSALVSGRISKFAVINGEIVREGDWFQRYKIRRIAKDGVWIYDGEETYKLYLAKN